MYIVYHPQLWIFMFSPGLVHGHRVLLNLIKELNLSFHPQPSTFFNFFWQLHKPSCYKRWLVREDRLQILVTATGTGTLRAMSAICMLLSDGGPSGGVAVLCCSPGGSWNSPGACPPGLCRVPGGCPLGLWRNDAIILKTGVAMFGFAVKKLM